jgi:hypothetical protein
MIAVIKVTESNASADIIEKSFRLHTAPSATTATNMRATAPAKPKAGAVAVLSLQIKNFDKIILWM